MHCRQCGELIDENAVICVKCGTEKGKGTEYCAHCGSKSRKTSDGMPELRICDSERKDFV